MKKHLLTFVFAIITSAIQAQNGELYSLLYRNMVEEDLIFDFIQQRNGEFVMNTFIEEIEDDTYIPLGNMFYKISHTAFTITDSLFVEDTAPFILLAHYQQGDGNIMASFRYHEDCDSTFLHICRFTDDNFYVNYNEDIVVPVCEGFVLDAGGIVDCRGDLIIMYFKERPTNIYDIYLARFDSNGIMKHQELLFENNLNGISMVRVLKESPLQYYLWKRTNDSPSNLIVYNIDSLFHKNPIILNSTLSEEIIDPNMPYVTANEYLSINGDTEVISAGGDDILVAAQYVYDTTGHPMTQEYGVTVAKYDLRTMQLKKYIVFNDYPGYYNPAKCLGLKMMTDGTVYFLYKEHGYPEESIVVVKMDSDLNVEWKRFFKTENIIIDFLQSPILYKDEYGEEQGIAWAGYGRNTNNNHHGVVCFFLNHDGTMSTNESGIEVRPYAYYPNPVKEQLLMQFSPDVQPTQVELYDLQGRLVRTQSNAFESIDMSQLPAGTYTLRVTLEDGKAYSDKVVKE